MLVFHPSPLQHEYFENHQSSLLNPSVIDSYILSEQAVGRYSPGFSPIELERLIGPFCTSPLGLVPKPHSDKFRIVQDLSYPRNIPDIRSVNADINSDDFPTMWGTFSSTAALILSLPPGCVAATFDISAAYRTVPVLPLQQNALCIFWKGLVYVDRALMFGLTSSAGVFGSVADMLVAIYGKAGFERIRKWVNDFLVIRLPHEHWTEEDFMDLTGHCGVPWSLEKLRRFAPIQRYIGFDWDLDRKIVSLPSDKLCKVQELITSWLCGGASFTAREAAGLHGKLVHVSCIFPLIRPFLRSIARFAAAFHSPRARLSPPSPVLADLRWIQSLLLDLPNAVPIVDPSPVDIGWWGDASTSFGIGVVIGTHWSAWRWAPGFRVGPKQPFDIGWAEAVAVELGLRMAIHLGIISPSLSQGMHYLVRSDNAGIVAVTNKGRSRSLETNSVLKQVYRLQAENGIRLHATYVSTHSNIADALSRGDITTFLAGFPSASTPSPIPLPLHLVGKLTPLLS